MKRHLALSAAREDHPDTAETGPPATIASRTTELPRERTSFVGRRDELAAVRRLLADTRVVVLTGPGGIGKTRLAAQVARTTVGAFPGGHMFVRAGDLPIARLVPKAHEATLVPDAPAGSPGEDGPALVVLDGAELAPAECREIVANLITSLPTVRILVTSRVWLGIPSSTSYAVPAMAVVSPERADAPVTHLLRNDSVALFVARATAADSAFALTRGNAADVAALCRALDGLPLAVELAAARCRALSPAQLLARLPDGQRLLRPVGTDDGLGHPGLPDVMAETARGCLPAELRLWSRASVFARDFTLEDIETVCCTDDRERDDAPDSVTGLVDRSVLECRQEAESVKYWFLAPLRAYGAAQLAASGEEKEIRTRHRDRFVRLAESSGPFWGGDDARRAFDHMLCRLDDVRLALDFCFDDDRPDLACQLAADLRLHWMVAGAMDEGAAWLQRGLAAVPRSAVGLRVRALAVLAYLAALAGLGELVEAALTEGRAIAGTESEPDLTYAEALAAFGAGDLDSAATRLESVLAQYAARGEDSKIREAAFNLGLVLAASRRPEDDFQAVEANLRSLTQEGAWWGTAWALMSRGFMSVEAGRHDEAETRLRSCLRLMRDRHDRLIVWWCLELLATTAVEQGDHRKALHLLGAARAHGVRVLAPLLAARQDRVLTAGDQALGPRIAAHHLERGQALSLTEAINIAIDELPADAGDPDEQLSERETEVARFIAQGLSNRDIAAKLVIATRTAEGHVQRILTKRRFHSRAQIAAWVAQLDSDGDTGR